MLISSFCSVHTNLLKSTVRYLSNVAYTPVGLLGIGSTRFYNDSMDLDAAIKIIRSQKLIIDAADADFKDFQQNEHCPKKNYAKENFLADINENLVDYLTSKECKAKPRKNRVLHESGPTEAFKVLQSWGVGDQLTPIFIDIFGGNYWLMYTCLERLVKPSVYKHDPISPPVYFGEVNAEVNKGLLEALQGAKWTKGLQNYILRSLRTLAITGFIPLTEKLPERSLGYDFDLQSAEQQMAALLLRYNLVYFVPSRESLKAYHINPALRQKDGVVSDGLIPGSQSTRMVIARLLHEITTGKTRI